MTCKERYNYKNVYWLPLKTAVYRRKWIKKKEIKVIKELARLFPNEKYARRIVDFAEVPNGNITSMK